MVFGCVAVPERVKRPTGAIFGKRAAARIGSPAIGGGLRPRPGKVFGCVAVPEQVKRPTGAIFGKRAAARIGSPAIGGGLRPRPGMIFGCVAVPKRVKRPTGAIFGKRAGAKPHGQKDKVLSPKKPILALPTSNQEPTLSGADWLTRHRGRTSSATR